MQVQHSNPYYQNPSSALYYPQVSLKKQTSSSTTISASRSTSSIESYHQSPSKPEEYLNQATSWILKLRKKLSIAKDTIYVAISYLNILVMESGFALTEKNYQCVAATTLLLSAKMNEIYPPKMSSLIYRATQQFSKQEIIEIEGIILEALDYNIAFTETPYHFLARILKEDNEKLEECQKLLSLVINNKDSGKSMFNEQEQRFHNGKTSVVIGRDQMLALAIVYLIKPSQLREYSGVVLQKIKILAGKVYNIYVSAKAVSRNQLEK